MVLLTRVDGFVDPLLSFGSETAIAGSTSEGPFPCVGVLVFTEISRGYEGLGTILAFVAAGLKGQGSMSTEMFFFE